LKQRLSESRDISIASAPPSDYARSFCNRTRSGDRQILRVRPFFDPWPGVDVLRSTVVTADQSTVQLIFVLRRTPAVAVDRRENAQFLTPRAQERTHGADLIVD
jgi:hypothetical protein